MTLLWATSLHPDYGFFLDELYYLACSARPALGYVDHPPLAPWVLAGLGAIGLDHLLAVRAVAALCGVVTILATARMACRLGGGTAAQLLAGLLVITAPVLLLMFSVFSTNAFELMFATLLFAVLVELLETRQARLWPLAGLLLGLAIQSKHTGVILAGGLAAGLALSPARIWLREPRFWLGAGIAFVVVLPNLLWQLAHDFASLTFYRASDAEGNVATSVLEVFAEQVGSFNPAAFPIWAAGFWLLSFGPRGRSLRMLGVTAAVLFVALLAGGKSRPDRVMELYPLLFAAGSVQLESVFLRRGFGWLRVALPVFALLLQGVVWPSALPLLSPETSARVMESLAEENEQQREVGTKRLNLPLAHRMGNEEVVEAVARVFASLPAAQRENAVILAESYAPAAALEWLGDDLPPVYSGHNNYHLWGPPAEEPELVIAVGFEPEQLLPFFAEVEVVHRTECHWCMGWRQDAPVALARAPRRPLADVWPELRRYGMPARKLYLIEGGGVERGEPPRS
jgi:4-amino-4-deoxy-L-arabinose transferase-like glycosyltransferase